MRLNGRSGVIDTTGKEVTSFKYDGVVKFSEGFAVVRLNGKSGVIDTTGKEVVPPLMYDEVYNFSNGFARVEQGGWAGYKGIIDATGREVVPCRYTNVYIESNGLILVKNRTAKYGFFDTTGKEVIPCKYDDEKDFSESFVWMKEDGHWGLFDTTGKEILPCIYEDVSYFSESLAWVKLSGKWGVIDATGKEALHFQYQYDKLQYDRESGFATVMKTVTTSWSNREELWGLLSITEKRYTATPTNDALKVDGKAQVPTAYKIEGANYFQLRDVAMMLNGTPAQFSVDYDADRQAVIIVTGQPYKPLGTELAGAAKNSTEAILGNNDIYINGEKADFAVYKINGANFFQIRALGQALGFNVGWTAEQGMFIESDKPYDPAN